MAIELTKSAIEATHRFFEHEPAYRGLDLRIYLAGKHCDGFEYGVSFDARDDGDKVIPVDNSVNIICDEKTLEFVNGSIIDWVDDDRGRGYLVLNPHHRKFRGKFFKKSEWKFKLTKPAN